MHSRNLSVLFVRKIWQFSNPPSPPPCGRHMYMVPKMVHCKFWHIARWGAERKFRRFIERPLLQMRYSVTLSAVSFTMSVMRRGEENEGPSGMCKAKFPSACGQNFLAGRLVLLPIKQQFFLDALSDTRFFSHVMWQTILPVATTAGSHLCLLKRF